LLDRIDLDLLTQLREDGRASWTTLGTAVGLSADAVRVRVERLISEGLARPSTLVDPTVFGYGTRVDVGIKTLGDVAAFIDWARAQDGLIHLVRVAGRFSFLAELVVGSLEDAFELANVQLGAIACVVGVEVMPFARVARWRDDTRPNWIVESSAIDVTDGDIEILRLLVDEPRIGLADMSNRLGRPYAPLRRRVHALYTSGIIRTTVVVDDAAASGSVSALLLIGRAGDVGKAEDAALACDEVTILVSVAGRFAFAGELVSSSLIGLESAATRIASASGASVEYLPYVHVEKLPASLSFHDHAAGR
jgi:DNA-binding Lrp family transcriptional regulator